MRQIIDARHRAHLTTQQAADLCGVTLRTYQRWESGFRKPPPSAIRLLESRADLGTFHKAWSGWQIYDEYLHMDTGVFFSIGEIRYLELLQKYVKRLESEVRYLRKRTPVLPCERRPKHGTENTAAPKLAEIA